VSTRSVDDLVKAMGMSGISKSQVSRLCIDIDDKVKAFLSPLCLPLPGNNLRSTFGCPRTISVLAVSHLLRNHEADPRSGT
jgi:hypothetical protein